MASARQHCCLAIGLALCAASAVRGESLDRRWTHSGNGSVTIDNAMGRVEVVGWSKPEVELRGELGRGARLDAELMPNAQLRLAVVLDSPPGDSTRRGTAAARMSSSSTLRLQVPFAVALTITSVTADVSVQGIRNSPSVVVRTVSGEQAVAFTGRDARLKTVSGNLRLSGAAPHVALSSVSGDIDLRDFAGGAVASVVSGELRVDNSQLGVLTLDSVTGDIEVAATPLPQARWKMESLGGDVSVEVPALDRMAIDADTFSGSIDARLPSARDATVHGRRGKQLRLRPDGAQARVLVETFSGSISLRTMD